MVINHLLTWMIRKFLDILSIVSSSFLEASHPLEDRSLEKDQARLALLTDRSRTGETLAGKERDVGSVGT